MSSTPVRIVTRDIDGNFIEVDSSNPLPITDTGGGGNVVITGPLGQTTKAGSLPVTIASDQDNLAVNLNSGLGTAITETGGSLNVNLTGGSLGLSESSDSILVYGNDGATNRVIKTDASGELQVDVLSQPALSDSTDSVSIGDGTDTLGVNADGSIDVAIVNPTGQTTKANSIPVTLASDEDNVEVNLNDGAGTSLTSTGNALDVNLASPLGQDVMASSLPVTISSDQSPLSINDTTPINTQLGDSPSIDAFARARVSESFTLFDSKQIFDNQPLLWDDSEVSGGGTTSVHSVNEAATTISVGASTAGKRVRQTFRSFNYQPGKSQMILMTFSEMGTLAGITKEAGQFNDNNGLFFRSDEGTASFCRRTFVTGAAVTTVVNQASWNIDTMDGAGSSGITLDFDLSQIFIFDYEWLGVGRVRMGFVIDGLPVYAHEFLNANNLGLVYMSTPNLPLRYSIENDGTGAADDFMQICSTVISEGGQQEVGTLRYTSTAGTHVDANAANTLYAIVGIKLKAGAIGATVQITDVSLLTETSDNFEWILMWNPVVAGTFTYTDIANSAIQEATGATANTVTGGTQIAGGFASVSAGNAGAISSQVNTILALGATIAGVVDTMVLCARPLSSNADIQGGVNWRELS